MGKKTHSSSSSHGKTSSHSSAHSHEHDYQEEMPKAIRDEMRRRRNIESAKRSRERKQQQERVVEMQVYENERRIRYLEQQVRDLSNELETPSPYIGHSGQRRSSRDSRPAWFGAPF